MIYKKKYSARLRGTNKKYCIMCNVHVIQINTSKWKRKKVKEGKIFFYLIIQTQLSFPYVIF